MSDMLIELFSEEIPSFMQEPGARKLEETLVHALIEHDIAYEKSEHFSSPRRIAVIISGIAEQIPAKTIEKKGPKVHAAKEAVEGFIKNNKAQHSDLVKKNINGEDVYYLALNIPERNTVDILAEILPKTILNFKWPKSVKLGSGFIEWVRPLRNILCILDREIVQFTCGNLRSNNQTFGHRFLSPKDLIAISRPKYYLKLLSEHYVDVSRDARKSKILKGILDIEKKLNLTFNDDQMLANEVAGFVEHPSVLHGSIETAFLKLPKELLVTTLRTHQRYFTFFDKNGNLAPYFGFAVNIIPKDPEVIIKGNERVTTARLNDAMFCFQNDQSLPIETLVSKLMEISFHVKLGSIHQKARRIAIIATDLARVLNLDTDEVYEVALALKADLATQTVSEFPELEGIIGGYLTADRGNHFASAVREHYLPRDATDALPQSNFSAIFAIADKIDSIVGLFLVGEEPTGSRDPFALRRAGLGIIRNIIHHDMRDVSLSRLIKIALDAYNNVNALALEQSTSPQKTILSFLNDRSQWHLIQTYDQKIIDACNKYLDKPALMLYVNTYIKQFLVSEQGVGILAAMKRVLNVIDDSIADKHHSTYTGATQEEVDLARQVEIIEAEVGSLLKSDKVDLAIAKFSTLSFYINGFIDSVVVNDADINIKMWRTNLLKRVRSISEEIILFSKI